MSLLNELIENKEHLEKLDGEANVTVLRDGKKISLHASEALGLINEQIREAKEREIVLSEEIKEYDKYLHKLAEEQAIERKEWEEQQLAAQKKFDDIVTSYGYDNLTEYRLIITGYPGPYMVLCDGSTVVAAYIKVIATTKEFKRYYASEEVLRRLNTAMLPIIDMCMEYKAKNNNQKSFTVRTVDFYDFNDPDDYWEDFQDYYSAYLEDYYAAHGEDIMCGDYDEPDDFFTDHEAPVYVEEIGEFVSHLGKLDLADPLYNM